MHKRSDSLLKGIISLVNYSLIRFLFRAPFSDFQNVTFYPSHWIQSLSLEARTSFANPEGLIKSYWSGKSVKEVEINFLPRRRGEAKGTKWTSLVSSFWDIIRLWVKWVLLGKIPNRRRKC